MKAIHYVLLVCASLVAGLPNLAPAMPPQSEPYLKALTAVLVLVVSVLGAVSNSALSQEPAKAASASPAQAASASPAPAPAASSDPAATSAKPVAP